MTSHLRCIFILFQFIFAIYTTKQGHGWQSSDILLYSTEHDINLFNTSRIGNSKLKTTTLVNNLTKTTAITYCYAASILCWSDHDLENIQCASFKEFTARNKTEVVNGVISPDGLACDWYTNKLYWTDSDANRIEVATIDGKHRRVLFWTELDQPRTVALAPMKGLMFWTDWGEIPKIERAGMNGDHETRKMIVSDNIFWPNGMTIDFEEERIYWIDAKLQIIDSIDYDGKNRKNIAKGFEYPHSLTHFQNRFYYTDWKTWSIHAYNKTSSHYKSNSSQRIIEELAQTPIDIHVWHPKCQPREQNPCDLNNGGCSHLCLLAPYPPHYSCVCPIGIKNITNLTCANSPEEILLLARRTDINIIYLDSPEYTYKTIELNNTNFTIAVDYDLVEGYLYWTDSVVRKIQKAKLNAEDQQDVVTNEIEFPDGIAVDWISRNIYWSDTGPDRIEVITISGGYRKVLISEDLDEPRALAVAAKLGWLFWTDWSAKKPKIERSNLDGTERKVLIWNDLTWPNGVTLDTERLKIYWCDARQDKIEYANMDGTNRRVLIQDDVPHVFGFSLMGDYIYWTDWQRRTIERAHKETGSKREVIVEQLPSVMGLKAVNLKLSNVTNECTHNRGNCSQICLPRHGKPRICACQTDYELQEDGYTCAKPKAFLLYTTNNSIGRIGLENKGNKVTLAISGDKHPNTIDYDINTMRIYWSDSKSKTIMRAFVNGSDPHRIVEGGLTPPRSVAIDWISLNVYWTDAISKRIEVSRLQGSSRRTLLWDEIYEPHSLVLDPAAGYMYWSEWGNSNIIKKAAMDGSNQREFIGTGGHATSLAIDYAKRRLYWVEIDLPIQAILSSDLDGNDKRYEVRDQKYQPQQLTLYKNHIYWGEKSTGNIYATEKENTSNTAQFYSFPENFTNLLVFDSQKQTGSNQCGSSNGGCHHLCLPLPADSAGRSANFKCACPTHYTLQGKECIPPKQFMIYSQKNLAVRLVLDTSECPEAVLPIHGLKMVKAIDFDPVKNQLYWIEGKSHSLKRSKIGDTGIPTVVLGANKELQPFDIALDPIGRLLFWTCAKQDVINVTRLDNNVSFGVVLHGKNEKPRLLAIHAVKRLLFFTDIGATPQLVRTRLDGSHRIVITKASDISAIAVDSQNDLVVWSQGQSIYISNIDGENQHVLSNESNSRITQLTVHLGWLYWIDKDHLLGIELVSGKSRSTQSIQASHITDLISVTVQDSNHLCNKTCSHFCILKENSPVCACPKDKILQDDNRTCVMLPNCGNDYFTCSVSHSGETRDCIPKSWRCDMQKDCTDGSDELDCKVCGPKQHRCQDGECLDPEAVCDGVPQCNDGSDETKCCFNSFQCPDTDVCISHQLRCDGVENCADGADEVNCEKTEPMSSLFDIIMLVAMGVSAALGGFFFVLYCYRKKKIKARGVRDQCEDPLSPAHLNGHVDPHKLRKTIPDVVRMSMMNGGSNSSSYDRNHITGASSSTNGSSLTCYPRETLNPPPSPATTAASTRGSSPSSRYRPYRHYRAINQPPPPTPCSTDVCDESDYNYPTRSRYDAGPFPPPPTPRSHCHSESCPPSPSSRSSTYFSPLPPPPSPVASPPRGYDS